MFEDFDGFDFMFENEAVPIHITEYKADGKTIKRELDDREPIIVGTTFGTSSIASNTFPNGGGGYTPVLMTNWVSRHHDFSKNTVVMDLDTGISYKVTNAFPNRHQKLTYYQLTNNDDSDLSQGGGESVSTDTGHPNEWY